MDFEGISLRRKFLTGLEPESINLMIGWCFCPCGDINKILISHYYTRRFVQCFKRHFSTVRFFASRKAWKAE